MSLQRLGSNWIRVVPFGQLVPRSALFLKNLLHFCRLRLPATNTCLAGFSYFYFVLFLVFLAQVPMTSVLLLSNTFTEHEIASSVCSEDRYSNCSSAILPSKTILNLKPDDPSRAPLKSLDEHIQEKRRCIPKAQSETHLQPEAQAQRGPRRGGSRAAPRLPPLPPRKIIKLSRK